MRLLVIILTLLSLNASAQFGQGMFFSSRKAGVTAPVDADATAFIARVETAGGTLTQSQKDAIHTFAAALKTNNLYTIPREMWLFVGGVAASNALGFKNVNNGSFSGTITHSTTGFTNSANGYFNTLVNPSTMLTIDNTHLAFYSRTAAALANADMGAQATTAKSMQIKARLTNNTFNVTSYSAALSGTSADGSGFFLLSKPSNTELSFYRNGTLLGQSTAVTSGTLPTAQILLGALNNGGTPALFNVRDYAFASIGAGFTQVQSGIYSTLVTNLMTGLGR